MEEFEMKRHFMNRTLHWLKENARVVILGFGVKLIKKAMYEKTSSRFIQELERTMTHVSTTCAHAIICITCIYYR